MVWGIITLSNSRNLSSSNIWLLFNSFCLLPCSPTANSNEVYILMYQSVLTHHTRHWSVDRNSFAFFGNESRKSGQIRASMNLSKKTIRTVLLCTGKSITRELCIKFLMRSHWPWETMLWHITLNSDDLFPRMLEHPCVE